MFPCMSLWFKSGMCLATPFLVPLDLYVLYFSSFAFANLSAYFWAQTYSV